MTVRELRPQIFLSRCQPMPSMQQCRFKPPRGLAASPPRRRAEAVKMEGTVALSHPDAAPQKDFLCSAKPVTLLAWCKPPAAGPRRQPVDVSHHSGSSSCRSVQGGSDRGQSTRLRQISVRRILAGFCFGTGVLANDRRDVDTSARRWR